MMLTVQIPKSPVEEGRAKLFAARGRYVDAELAYRKAVLSYRDALAKSKNWPNQPPPDALE